MGIYANNIEKLFRDLPELENVLQKYDNVTYHIQFFMVPMKTLTKYSQIKTSINAQTQSNRKKMDSLLALEKELYRRAIIIAESGVTNTINIDSLTMVTHPPAGQQNFGDTTIEMDLSLTEFNSSSLVNKIALASKLCGYESYTYQQYFISIWFTGYDQKTGKPINKIPLDEEKQIKQCTYEVTMGDVKTQLEGNKTTYQLKLYPSFYSSLSKEINDVSGLGEIKINLTNDFGTYIQEFEDKVNNQLKHQYGKEIIEYIYKNERPFEIVLTQEIRSAASLVDKQFVNQVGKGVETAGDSSKSWWERGGAIIDVIGGSIAYGGFHAFSSWGWMKETVMPSNSIEKTVADLASHYDLYKEGYVIRYKWENVYVGTYKNISYYKHKLILYRSKAAGLKEIQEDVIGVENSPYTTEPAKYQELYLKAISENGYLKKKYYWMFNGHNTDVLSVKTDDSSLWYLNIGLTDLYAIRTDLPSITYVDESTKLQNDIIKVDLTTNYSNYFQDEDASVRYIDDVYYQYVQNKNFNEINSSTWYKIAESNSPFSEVPTSASVVSEEKASNMSEVERLKLEKQIKYKLGMENIFQVTGQKIKMDLDILGDPYWLFFGDLSESSVDKELPLPHFLMFQRSFHEVDSFDRQQEDKLMEYNSLYTVTKIVSTFESGVFKQRITGFVSTPFIQSSRFENYVDYSSTSTSKQSAKAIDANVDSKGNVMRA